MRNYAEDGRPRPWSPSMAGSPGIHPHGQARTRASHPDPTRRMNPGSGPVCGAMTVAVAPSAGCFHGGAARRANGTRGADAGTRCRLGGSDRAWRARCRGARSSKAKRKKRKQIRGDPGPVSPPVAREGPAPGAVFPPAFICACLRFLRFLRFKSSGPCPRATGPPCRGHPATGASGATTGRKPAEGRHSVAATAGTSRRTALWQRSPGALPACAATGQARPAATRRRRPAPRTAHPAGCAR